MILSKSKMLSGHSDSAVLDAFHNNDLPYISNSSNGKIPKAEEFQTLLQR